MSRTSVTVMKLKSAGEDNEWYPTTAEMIEVVMRRLPQDAKSIMDIGAGDGRVLERFAEKCHDATLYGIELSPILVQAQSEKVIPIGTDFLEQNLSCLPADYIFCNPPYSEYEEWVCKIIAEGYAIKAFVVIPQRWKDAKGVAQSLKLRGATTRILHSDDFLNAERRARAVVDIVEISYPRDKYGDEVKDPFDIWFDQNVDVFAEADEFRESETGRDLARKYANASIDDMVAAYQQEHDILVENYRAIFKLDYAVLKELGVNKDHVREGLKKKIAGLKIKYWQILFERLDAITSRLATKSKGKLLDKLTSNTSVEFTTSNAYTVVIWAIKNANQYFDDQLVELFHDLSYFEGVLNYKSNVRAWVKDGWRYGNHSKANTHYALDYRIVVGKYNAINKDGYDRWNYPGGLHKECHDMIADVVAVMSNLGFSTLSTRSLDRVYKGGQWQDFYAINSDDILFQVKAYQNGNLHFRFMPDAIKALNVSAGRLLKWLRTEDDVVTELGYTREEAKEYFNHSSYLPTSSVLLLGAPNSD